MRNIHDTLNTMLDTLHINKSAVFTTAQLQANWRRCLTENLHMLYICLVSNI